MSHASVPILDTILKSWTDAFRAMRDMPVVAACGLVLYSLIAVGVFLAAGAILMHRGRSVDEWAASPAWLVFVVFSAAVRVMLLAPLFIAIHRYVIRDESRDELSAQSAAAKLSALRWRRARSTGRVPPARIDGRCAGARARVPAFRLSSSRF